MSWSLVNLDRIVPLPLVLSKFAFIAHGAELAAHARPRGQKDDFSVATLTAQGQLRDCIIWQQTMARSLGQSAG